MAINYKDRLLQTRQIVDEISPSFCAAKWTQITMHLGNGTNHSCHHPQVHSFDLEDVQKNPNALHNTKYKKKLRKQMLEGERPVECDYCWRVEDANKEAVGTPGEVFSDRIVKSGDHWSKPYLNEIKNLPWDADYYPKYVEVDFENTCNFKCAYCSPSYSSQWQKEVRDHGHYHFPSDPHLDFNDMKHIMEHSKVPMKPEENPYIDAFWKWFPNAVKYMTNFRVTGGEPLMSKNLHKVLDYLIENPQPHLQFAINSNLNPKQELWDKFLEKLDIIIENRCVDSIQVYTSCEAHGKQAEYIRYGMDYNVWLAHLEKLLQRENTKVSIMCTFNMLSITTFKLFLEDILALKYKYFIGRPGAKHGGTPALQIDVPYLRHPEFLAAWVAPPNVRDIMIDTINWMYRNMEIKQWLPLSGQGFYEQEVEQVRRVYETAHELHHKYYTENTGREISLRRTFYQFVTEYDKRRGTNFLETFPEYTEFYNACKEYCAEWEREQIPVVNL